MSNQERSEHSSPDAFSPLAQAETGHWWFRSRNRLLLWLLETEVGAFGSFMEAGCGTGFLLEGLRNAPSSAELFGTEHFEEGLDSTRQRVPSASLLQLDATAMADVARFDVVGAFDVPEHIEQDELALANIVRALKPAGTVVITAPQHQWLCPRSMNIPATSAGTAVRNCSARLRPLESSCGSSSSLSACCFR